MRIQKVSATMLFVPVTNPHEGLWGYQGWILPVQMGCYESPWGVMSADDPCLYQGHCELRIPMRGYEAFFLRPEFLRLGVTNPHEGLWVALFNGFENGVFSYESPWGVMSLQRSSQASATKKLRIPMRGYETINLKSSASIELVTNPHEGLWEVRLPSQFTKKFKLRIPMRGYEMGMSPLLLFPWGVTNPHEGLWAMGMRLPCPRLSRYESPWGVMRSKLINAESIESYVTNPHEGLWVKIWVPWTCC